MRAGGLLFLGLLSVSFLAKDVKVVEHSKSESSIKFGQSLVSIDPKEKHAPAFYDVEDELKSSALQWDSKDDGADSGDELHSSRAGNELNGRARNRTSESGTIKAATNTGDQVDVIVPKKEIVIESQPAHIDFTDDLPNVQTATVSFVHSRKRAFEEAGMGVNWWLRGLGYLWEMRDMALAISAIKLPSAASPAVVVKIVNVHPNASGRDCDKLSIWVRVRGPEVVAATAQSVNTESQGCHWEYHADVRVAGEYAVDAKVLSWNAAGVRPSKRQCNSTTADTVPTEILEKYPAHAGFKAFKLYSPGAGCCEYCSRIPGCVFWMTPALGFKKPGYANNGCEFFFDSPDRRIPQSYLLHDLNTTWSTDEVFRRRRRLGAPRKLIEMGAPHSGQKLWFIGCGWSQMHTLDFPCMSGVLDDMVFALNNTFTLSPPPAPDSDVRALPLCELEDEFNGTTRGRWVKEPWPSDSDCPPFSIDPKFSKKFGIASWSGDKPHCWHRDDLTKVGLVCMEMNCRFIRPETKYFSPLRESQWMGVWRDRQCDYFEYTDQQLQQCFTENKIASITKEGRSIAEFIHEYVKQRTTNLKFYNQSDGVDVVISTLALLHKTSVSENDLRRELMGLPDITGTRQKVFVTSSFFLTSEREFLGLQENLQAINDMALELLPSKGYSFFNVREASTALSYDTATQMDGMHLIGPPMKLLITKFFHHLCKDQVEGERM